VNAVAPRIRWGIPDALLAWLVGIGGALFASFFVVDAGEPTQLVVLLVGQNAAVIGFLAMIARAKGLGSLRADFGFVVHPWDWPWFFAGVGLQLLALLPTALLVELHGEEARQDVVRIADKSHGVVIPLIALGVAVLAPVAEELLFRGVLLRALLRRTGPDQAVLVSALVFGAIHVIGDPSLGSVVALPVLVGLGIVLGYEAVRTGDISRSILLHVGFNTLTAVFLFV
jgi:uncharacterized protein